MNRRPNIIVFFTDQQRHDTTGAHGCELGLTPNFDWLASCGTHVANSFTCQPVCAPARASLQTGVYATQHGVWRNGCRPDPALPMLGTLFREGGYDTAYIGKWHLVPHQHHGPVPADGRGGYDYWLAANLLEFVSGPYDTRLWDADNVERRLPGYRVDAICDAAIRYIAARENAQRPYFLFVSLLEPHHQNHTDNYPAPAGYEDRYRNAALPPDLLALGGTSAQHWPGYCGLVKRCDEALGRLLDVLRSRGELEDTVVLYTADHGCHFKTRNREYKRSCHDASMRVPTALWGGPWVGGGRVDNLVSILDLPPTLLETAGIPIPSHMMGRSLLRRREPGWPDEVFAQISESETARVVRTRRWKYSVRVDERDASGNWVSRRSSDRYVDDCLYDLEADPWELTNLAGMPPYRQVVDDLRQRLHRCMRTAGEAEVTIGDAPPIEPFQRKPEFRGGSNVT